MTLIIQTIGTILMVAAITIFAFRKNPPSAYLFTIATASLTFLAFYWVTTFQNIYGFAFCIIIGALTIYTGAYALDLFIHKGGGR
jgi:hypothetical protein